jgi:hypothetical protein
MSFAKDINVKINAGAGNLLVLNEDEYRAETKIRQVAASRAHDCWVWKASTGLVQVQARPDEPKESPRTTITDPLKLAQALLAWQDGPSVVIAEDMVELINRLPTAPLIARNLKDLTVKTQTEGDPTKCVQLIALDTVTPQLNCGFQTVELELPSREELSALLDAIMESVEEDVQAEAEDNRERIINAVTGLPAYQAANALAESVARTGRLDADKIRDFKKQLVAEKALEWIDPDPRGLDSIGGMDEIKDWLKLRVTAFDTELAEEYNLEPPKGILVAGIPGTGKSQLAKAIASGWGFTLLRFNVGQAFGKYLGESESGFENALKTAEAVAPAILFIDEAEKLFSGVGGSGDTDGGTAKRMFGSFLNWLQEKQSQVFVFMTVNDPTSLPAEFTRAGRFDATWWIDVPTTTEREAIMDVFTAKYKKASTVDKDVVVAASDGYTGAEIENAIRESLYRALSEQREVTTEDVLSTLKTTNQVVKAWSGKLEGLREWAKNGARLANAPEKTKSPKSTVARKRNIKVGRR